MLFFSDNINNKDNAGGQPDVAFRFHEGYYYRMKFAFEENASASGTTGVYFEQPCDGELVFTIKVVPEYQKWTGAATDKDGNSPVLNWNNDSNWSRVSSNDLYRVADETDSYTTDGDNSNTFSYAPLDFTKVIIPAGSTYPYLFETTTTPVTEEDDNETFDWANKPSENTVAGEATDDIQYDMASRENNRGGIGCRPWYAHTCDQIHFRPNSEILNQQYLTYDRAWVDMEVASGRWYTLSSPLKAVVAGDMYLPSSGARQETELFSEITFDESLNDRFEPAVYQRAWNKASAMVYEINGSSRNVAVKTTWSNVYNDVNERYGEGTGFSIKTDVGKVVGMDNGADVLFRLPKDDQSYFYYDEEGRKKGNETTIDRSDSYKLNDTEGYVEVSASVKGKYFLVGNPFMSHIDMEKYLEANNDVIQPKYWVMTSDGQAASIMDSDKGFVGPLENASTLPPLQGFFVETIEPAQSVSLRYDADMITGYGHVTDGDGKWLRTPGLGLGGAGSRACGEDGVMRITAMRGGMAVTQAVINISPDAADGYDASEDVPMLVDPNQERLARVYTVAGNVASIVNTLPGITMTELGLMADEDETVRLRFDGTSCVDGAMLYDASTGEYTDLYDGMEYEVKGPSDGRLFITTGIEDAMSGGLTVGVSGREVYVTAPDVCRNLTLNVYDVPGRLIVSMSENSDRVSATLGKGMFVVEACGDGETVRKKIVVL